MAEEQVLKKEDGLKYIRSGFRKTKWGTLTVTKHDLYFVSKKGEELLRVPISNIVSVNTSKSDRADFLLLIYTDSGNERRAQLAHIKTGLGSMTIFPDGSANHFASWEQSINDARFRRTADTSSSLSDLERLAALKDRGILTADEFAAKKKELLGL